MIVVLSKEQSPECMAPEALKSGVDSQRDRRNKMLTHNILCLRPPKPQPAVKFHPILNDPRLKVRNLRMRKSYTQRTRPFTVKASAHREQIRYSKGSDGFDANGLARGLCYGTNT